MLRPVATRPLLLVLATCALAGCGESGPTDEQQIRSTLAEFERATARGDYRALCDRVLAPQLIETVGRVGLTCELAMQKGFEDLQDPHLDGRRRRGGRRQRDGGGALERRGPGAESGHGAARAAGGWLADLCRWALGRDRRTSTAALMGWVRIEVAFTRVRACGGPGRVDPHGEVKAPGGVDSRGPGRFGVAYRRNPPRSCRLRSARGPGRFGRRIPTSTRPGVAGHVRARGPGRFDVRMPASTAPRVDRDLDPAPLMPQSCSTALPIARARLERAHQRRPLERRVLAGQEALGRPAAAERAQPALAVLGDVIGERAEPARAGAGGAQVEPGAVVLERVGELVDARGRDGSRRPRAPARCRRARAAPRAGRAPLARPSRRGRPS